MSVEHFLFSFNSLSIFMGNVHTFQYQAAKVKEVSALHRWLYCSVSGTVNHFTASLELCVKQGSSHLFTNGGPSEMQWTKDKNTQRYSWQDVSQKMVLLELLRQLGLYRKPNHTSQAQEKVKPKCKLKADLNTSWWSASHWIHLTEMYSLKDPLILCLGLLALFMSKGKRIEKPKL